ncbi:MAG TPA: HD domain-containing protein [Solirubrobacteraceae bacterium]|nr:HD domain-containing protein [Solirubrobacteraceae bacterium]
MKVREFAEGSEICQALLVRSAQPGTASDGREFLRIELSDRSGTVSAIAWEEIAAASAHARPGEVLFVSGRFAVHPRYGPQIVLDGVRPAEESEYCHDDLHDGPVREPDHMEADLRELLATVHNPHLRRLLEGVFGRSSEVWPSYREAPAAKRYHQAYRHGLLEHSLSVAQAVSAISATFPGIDRDVAVTGALLHDIGKLEAYEVRDGAIEMSDHGRLYGEIALGYYRVRSMIEDIDGFPEDLAHAVLHIILSHHGSLEHGSPVVPCTREATLVHMIDNLGGRLGSFDRLEKGLPDGRQWSAYDKALGGGAYFARRTLDPPSGSLAREAA